MNNAELDAQVIALDAQRGASMLKAVVSFLSKFIAYPSEHALTAHTLWIVHCHMMDKWESTPRLAFLSPEPASGKTRALEITELLVPNPIIAVNVSAAYLFRRVGNAEDGVATLLVDEVDTIFGPKARENEEVRGLLNAGHRKGAVAGRCVAHGSAVVTEEIPAYAAVALAGLGWLPDTLLSRSVIIRMRRRRADERIQPYRRRIHATEGERIRAIIETWAPSAEVTWPEMPPGVEDRNADLWEALLSIADAAGGDWPKKARDAAVALVAATKEIEPSLGIRLLADLRTIFGAADAMSTKAILELLHKLEEAPWSDLRGKALDARGLASHLEQYGVKSKVVRIEGKTPRGYVRADLYDCWQRYLPSPAISATSATSATSQVDQPENVADDVAAAATGPQQIAADEIDSVADVADVADWAGDGDGQAGQAEAVADMAAVADQWRDALQADEADGIGAGPDVPDQSLYARLAGAQDAPGLSWREIDQLAKEVEEAAYHYVRENGVELDVEAEIRRRLLGRVFPEHLETETDRVWQRLFEVGS
jgi:hypothetical protein